MTETQSSDEKHLRNEQRRWGNWLMGIALTLTIIATLTDGDGRLRWWPPVLATVFAAAFATQLADAYRTGIAVWRFMKSDRSRDRIWFNLTVIVLGAFTVLSAALAFVLWRDIV